MNLAQYLAQSVSGVGVLGAIVGGAAAAAKNYKDHKDGLVTPTEAFYDTTKEAAGAGIATAVSAVAVGIVGGGLAISIGTALVVASGAKYAWDRTMEEVDNSIAKSDADELDEAIAKTA